jgi:NAD(P)-dependent dehydrogenase (short-subunit alcohol dehydrogenase family)
MAGIAQAALPDVDEDEGEDDQLMAINLKSVFLGMKYAIPVMATADGGSVVNWPPVGGPVSSPHSGVHSAFRPPSWP